MTSVRRLQALSYHEDITGLPGNLTLHRIFSRAWHLRHAEGWIVTLTEAPYNGPLGVRLPRATVAQLPSLPGSTGVLTEDRIEIGSLIIELRGASPWRPRPLNGAPPLAMEDLQALVARDEGAGGAIHTPLAAEELLLRGLVAMDAGEVGSAVLGLLGLGPGLTPSGDDVLCGLLTALHVLGARLSISNEWTAHRIHLVRDLVDAHAPRRTTALSWTLLHHAARGVAVEPLLDVLWNLGLPGYSGACTRLVAIGHSSGRDMLAGALLAVRSVLEVNGPAHGSALDRPG